MIKASEKCFELVKHFEGCKLKAYLDSIGLPTIGIGTTVYPDGKPVKLGHTCTLDQAKQWFMWDLNEAEEKVRRWLTNEDQLKQCQFDALVSFTYNVGWGKTLITTVNVNPNDKDIENIFMMYVKAGKKTVPGLVRRRRSEAWLYIHNELKYFD